MDDDDACSCLRRPLRFESGGHRNVMSQHERARCQLCDVHFHSPPELSCYRCFTPSIRKALGARQILHQSFRSSRATCPAVKGKGATGTVVSGCQPARACYEEPQIVDGEMAASR